jgi:hypothetical protein
VTSNYPFKVVNGKNDAVESYNKGTSIESMAKQCYKTCVEFNCLAFEVYILAHWVASSTACVLP